MLWWTHFGDVWTTIWWIVQIQCAVFQNEKSFNKTRIPKKLFTLHSTFCVVLSLIGLLRGNWSGKNLGMFPRPRTPSPSACCGNGCTPCVMDLHQQVVLWSMTCTKTREWGCSLAQEVEMWLREGDGGEEKCTNVDNLQPFNYTEFEVVTKSQSTNWTASRWWRLWRRLKAVGSTSCVWDPLKFWAIRYRNGLGGGCCNDLFPFTNYT